MARNSDRQFSESESLKARDQGASFPEAEERLPAWAQEREETAERERDNANQAPEQDAEGPGEEACPDGSFAGPDAPTGREQAQEAWNREAQRVESSQFRRNMAQDPADRDGSGLQPALRQAGHAPADHLRQDRQLAENSVARGAQRGA